MNSALISFLLIYSVIGYSFTRSLFVEKIVESRIKKFNTYFLWRENVFKMSSAELLKVLRKYSSPLHCL